MRGREGNAEKERKTERDTRELKEDKQTGRETSRDREKEREKCVRIVRETCATDGSCNLSFFC